MHLLGVFLLHLKKIEANTQELINAVIKLKPSTAKGIYVKAASIASTMSPGISLDTKSIQ